MSIATKFFNTKVGMFVRTHDVDILTYGGIALMGGAVVMSAVEMKKYINEEKNRKEVADKASEGCILKFKKGENIIEKVDIKKAERYSKRYVIKNIAKRAAIPAAMYTIGAFACGKANSLGKSRYISVCDKLAAATALLAAYREKTQNEIGVDKENELYNSVVEETEKKPEVRNSESFTFCWDSFSRLFNKNFNDLNLVELRTKNEMFSIQAKKNGYIWLNDMLESMDLARVSYGYDYGIFMRDGKLPDKMVEIVGKVDDQAIWIKFNCEPLPIKKEVYEQIEDNENLLCSMMHNGSYTEKKFY